MKDTELAMSAFKSEGALLSTARFFVCPITWDGKDVLVVFETSGRVTSGLKELIRMDKNPRHNKKPGFIKHIIQNNGKSGGLDDGTSDRPGFQSYVSPQDFQRRPGASANPNATASWRASSGSLCWRQLLRFWRPTSLAPCPSTSLERIFDLQDIGPWQAGQPVSKVQKFRKHRGGRAKKGLRLVLYSLRLWESWFLSKKHEQLGLRMPKKCQKVSFFVKKPGFD
jgi:hypothetical protein